MAKEIYKSGNYIVTVDADDNSRLFPIGKTVYDEYNSVFRLTEGIIEDDQLIISYADSNNWVDDSAVAYTEATLRTFLRENTGFNPASGGSGAEWGDITGTLSTQTDLQSELDDKQDTLVSATNIKTINGTSVLGSGDLEVGGGSGYHVQLLPGGTLFGGVHQSNLTTGSSTYGNVTAADQIFYFPFIPNNTFTSTEMRINCSLAGAGEEAKICIYSHDGLNAPQNKLYESASLDLSTTGYKTVNVTRNWTKGEVYWLAVHMKVGNARITGSGTNKPDTILIGLLNSNRIKTWGQTGQTFANGAPATASPNTFRYDTFIVEMK